MRVKQKIWRTGDYVGTKEGTSRGLVFDPNDPDVFISLVIDIVSINDFAYKEWECWAGQEGKSGYLDGPIDQGLLFNSPGQMIYVPIDSEGNIILQIQRIIVSVK